MRRFGGLVVEPKEGTDFLDLHSVIISLPKDRDSCYASFLRKLIEEDFAQGTSLVIGLVPVFRPAFRSFTRTKLSLLFLDKKKQKSRLYSFFTFHFLVRAKQNKLNLPSKHSTPKPLVPQNRIWCNRFGCSDRILFYSPHLRSFC